MSIFDSILANIGATASALLGVVAPTAVATGNAAADAAAAGAAIQATAVNNQNFTISTQTSGYRNPTWVAPYPIADVTYPDAMNLLLSMGGSTGGATAGTGHTHLLAGSGAGSGPGVINLLQNQSIGAYVTISNPTVMDTVGLYVYANAGTLNNVFLEVFREDATTTALTRIFSTDVSGSITTTPAKLEVSLGTLIVQSGERYMVRLRHASTVATTVFMAGLTRSTISPNISFATATSGLSAQTSYTASEVATAHITTILIMWAMLAATSYTMGDQSFSDDYNRSALGGLWALTHTAGSSDITVASNKATFTGTTTAAQHALYIRATAGNATRVDCDVTNSALATSGARSGPFLNANQDLSQMVFLGVTYNAVNIYSGSAGSLTSRATISRTSNDGAWSLYYDVSLNTYVALFNGVAVGLSWNDSGNLMTHAAGFRLGGIRIERTSSVNGANLDNWTLRDYTP